MWNRSCPALCPGWFLGILVFLFRYDTRFIIRAPPHIKSIVDMLLLLFFLEDKSTHLEFLFIDIDTRKIILKRSEFYTRILEAVDLQLSTVMSAIKPINSPLTRFAIFVMIYCRILCQLDTTSKQCLLGHIAARCFEEKNQNWIWPHVRGVPGTISSGKEIKSL